MIRIRIRIKQYTAGHIKKTFNGYVAVKTIFLYNVRDNLCIHIVFVISTLPIIHNTQNYYYHIL
jgi:hypothetical protein